uniref:Uncharacterized protein n=1 Tax=Trichobilharzia regenti TaxID=157069 RepID=A0AA85J2Q3_TRIRE|nr:unnamed protein product [Trichobilharzia regenti]
MSKNIITGVMSTKRCFIKYIIISCVMIAVTMIITLLISSIDDLNVPIPENTSTTLMFSCGILALGLLLVPNLEGTSPVNYILAAVSVFISSFALAITTSAIQLWSLLSWSVTIFLAVIAITLGYKMKRLGLKGYYVIGDVIFGLMLSGAISFIVFFSFHFQTIANAVLSGILVLGLIVALLLNGQELKRCNDMVTDSLLSFKLALLTWTLVFLQYITASHFIAVFIFP